MRLYSQRFPLTPLGFDILAFLISLGAGLLGSILGIGGGIIIVPALTLLFGIDIRYAIGASIVAVVATSSGAAAAYLRERITNNRVAMVLEIATTSGAISGAFIAGYISTRWLYFIFGVIMAYTSLMMFRRRYEEVVILPKATAWAEYLRLPDSYYDEALGKEVSYKVVNTRGGLALMYIAGVVSGLLGIGSGALKVPAMDLVMRLPLKVSTATSNFMIGVTATASAGVYFMRGDIDPYVAAPVATGVLIGAILGARLLRKIRSSTIRAVFILMLLVISAQMLIKGVRG